ncbi:unnamed protein product [Thlaspi arvense]|uniref:Jacalin-type lectin domain-containing protein n=1 Tax=Thlaspi arvense TaxID=13288 RepID=A0AAU9R977_THLAR|nr:unnamed protein product [Thlaspi arvense]
MSQKVGAIGGNYGVAFDDGVFDGVKKITVGKDLGCVSYIKIEYEKDGKSETREHGTIRGELTEFAVEYPNEYITSVAGTYDHVRYYESVLVKSLIFRTSYRRTSPALGGDSAGKQFMLEGKTGGRLLGFHGRSGQALDSIGAYFFAPNPPLRHFNREGGNGGSAWDDGAYDGVRKILVGRGGKFVSYVRFEYARGERMVPHAHGKRQEAPQEKITVGADEFSITYIKIEYEKDGKVEIREHGTNRGELKEFSVNYPNDYIIAVGGSYNHIFNYDTTLITSLYFTTSRGFTSPLFGEMAGTEFNLKGENGAKLLGFHGRGGYAIDAIGAFFETRRPLKLSVKIGPIGGTKGNTFDDGVFDGVKKVTVGKDEYSVTYIKIEYANGGKFETREHGTARGELKEFSVDYPNEYIIAVGGSYNHIFNYDTTLITSLFFKTSKGFTSPLFGEMAGTEFNLEGQNGGQLIGFHGRGGYAIDAIGAHFEKLSSLKIGPVGGNKGNTFDDGVFDGVKKITVTADEYSVTYIKIEYANDGKFETREHGTARGELKEFSVNYPNDNITAVGGSYNHIFNYDTTLITSLFFKTSRGFTSPLFGEMAGTEFTLEGKNGGKLLGFHGRGGGAIDAIGAHFQIVSG